MAEEQNSSRRENPSKGASRVPSQDATLEEIRQAIATTGKAAESAFIQDSGHTENGHKKKAHAH